MAKTLNLVLLHVDCSRLLRQLKTTHEELLRPQTGTCSSPEAVLLSGAGLPVLRCCGLCCGLHCCAGCAPLGLLQDNVVRYLPAPV